MSIEEIDAIRNRSKASNSGPWVTDYSEMAKKTVFKRASKWITLSPEIRDGLEKDEEDPTAIVNQTFVEPRFAVADELLSVHGEDKIPMEPIIPLPEPKKSKKEVVSLEDQEDVSWK